MLNEDKIKLMTGIAMFEKREGKKIFPVNRYFKGDYVSSNMIRSFFSYTFCYLLGIMLWVLYHIEGLLNSFDIGQIMLLGSKIGILYLAGLIIYEVITFYVYRKRYEYARRGLKVYVAKLKRLEKRYEFQSKSKELAKEGGRRDGATRI